jgi:hypothetical protein
VDDAQSGVLDPNSVLFTDQDQGLSDPRGTVTALITVQIPSGSTVSVIQTIGLYGDGGAIQTALPVAQAITSTGPLGDLILRSTQGITANVTAPSTLGNITTSGPISGTIQTTGIRTDMTTGQQSSIAADFGRTFTTAQGNLSVTTVTAQGTGITGQLISRGNLYSQINANGGISGVIAAQGDLGVIRQNSSGTLVRLGGILTNNPVSSQIITLGTINGDLLLHGGLKGGRIAARRGIVGNTVIDGGLDPASALVSGGVIGNPALGTALTVNGTNYGIIAAKGAITFAKRAPSGYVFNNASTTDPISAAAVDAIFADSNGQPLSFDVTPLDLKGLAQIENNLKNLHVGKNGKLTIVPGA